MKLRLLMPLMRQSSGNGVTRCGFAAAVVCLLLACPVDAHASSPVIKSFSVKVSTSQAGGHPDLTTTYFLGRRGPQNPAPSCNCQDARNITFEYPAGVVGDPTAVPYCSAVDFAQLRCPPDSQVGIVNVQAGLLFDMVPVYNTQPRPGDPGLVAYNYPYVNFPVYFVLSARTESDYGLSAEGIGITQVFPLEFTSIKLWGNPASPVHDQQRFPLGVPNCYAVLGTIYGTGQEWNGCAALPGVGVDAEVGEYEEVVTSGGVTSNAAEVPFLQNPTNCGVPESAITNVLDYDGRSATMQAPWPTTTGCDQLTFNPSLFAQPTAFTADSPSGLEANLQVPQELSATVPSPTEIRASTVTLPEGFSINPSAADGKVACTEVQARFGTREEAQCPENSKIGALTIESSALPGPLPGFVYLGAPLPGERYRIFLVANGFSVHVKLAGTIVPNPSTGQIVVYFNNLPQSPLTDFNMHFFGSERGVLATPDQCGTYPVRSTFTPWDSTLPEQTSTQYFTIDSGSNGTPCPPDVRAFDPHLKAGAVNSAAGSHSPVSVEVTRSDGEQSFSGFIVSTPPGLSATLKGIPYCTSAELAMAESSSYSGLSEQASSACPPASQIGTSTAGAGAGTHPVYLPGKVYLAGPYKGAPLSLAVITPAVTGPYDLGNVVVRAALQVNPETAQVTAVSDPLPQIHEGIPLRLRDIRVNLDREGFTLNPTNCDPMSIAARLTGDQGAVADLTERFQVANCASLPFAPKLGLTLSGGLNRLGHPAIHAALTTKPGEANPSSISVTLPPNELIDNSHFANVCLKADFAAHTCPPGSLLGQVEVTSPLLDQPLRGGAYLRTSGRGLPDIALDLNGQFHIEAIGHIDSVHGGLRTTFNNIPDVPLGTVSFDLRGGSKGLVQNEEGICGARLKAAITMHGQNGALYRRAPKLRASCAGKSRRRSDDPRKGRS